MIVVRLHSVVLLARAAHAERTRGRGAKRRHHVAAHHTARDGGARKVALQHAKIINSCLQKWNINKNEIDLIASHGQTVYHAPKSLHRQTKFGNATLQIGDGDHLAVATGIITISDFRQKHIAAGGEGAPLAVYGDYLIFGKPGEDRILLNIGGIANRSESTRLNSSHPRLSRMPSSA